MDYCNRKAALMSSTAVLTVVVRVPADEKDCRAAIEMGASVGGLGVGSGVGAGKTLRQSILLAHHKASEDAPLTKKCLLQL